MAWIKNMKWIGSLIVLIGILTACSVSYKFNGASIDYAKTKTISFENFPNRSVGFVWGPMENMFNTALQDVYLQQARLTQVRRGGDLQLWEKSQIMMLQIKVSVPTVIQTWWNSV